MEAAPSPPPKTPKVRSLAPQEHGAYGQLFLPLATALWLADGAASSWLLAAAASAAFFAHEPLLIRLGHRGARRLREDGARAGRWGMGLLAVALGGAVLALATGAEGTVLACVPVLLLVLALAPFVWRRTEKTAAGELLAALVLTLTSVPVARAGGASWAAAITCGVAWAGSMVLATLAIRSVIARSKRRPYRALVAAVAVTIVAVSGAGAAAVHAGWVPAGALAAMAPVALVATALCLRPPSPRHLRETGWSVAAAGTLSLVLLCASLRGW